MTARDIMLEAGCEDAVIFTEPDYADAIIGTTHDGRAVYSYSKMIDVLIQDEGMTYEEAADWVDYNVIRSLPYMGEMQPCVVYDRVV